MTRFWKLLPVAGLVAGLSWAATAQPPAGENKKPGEFGGGGQGFTPGGPPRTGPGGGTGFSPRPGPAPLGAPDPDMIWNVMAGQGKDTLDVSNNPQLRKSMESRGMTVPADGIVTKAAWLADFKKKVAERNAGDPPAPRAPDRPAPKPDPTVDAWVKTLCEKITDPHDVVRDSARAAVIAAGRPALPILHKLGQGEDTAKSTAARKLIEAIERQPQPGLVMFGGTMASGGRTGVSNGPGIGAGRTVAPEGPNAERRPQPPSPNEGPRRKEGERRPDPFDAALRVLKLDEKQTAQLVEIHNDYLKKINALTRLDIKDTPPLREQLHKAWMDRVKEMLTDEQFEAFAEAMANNGPMREKP